MSISPIHDVVIAGAGPVGLFLACELRLAGVSVLVLEQSADPGSALKQSPFGMRGLSIPTVDAFRRRGLLHEVLAPTHSGGRPAGGHFAGIQFFEDKIDRSRWMHRFPDGVSGSVATTMERVETVLSARAELMGVEILRGAGVDGLDPSADGVLVHAGGRRYPCRWLVGCDGGRSTVRKLGGFDFVGTAPEFTGYSVQVEMADPHLLPRGRHYTPTGMYTYPGASGTISMVDFDGGAFHRTDAITMGHVQNVLRRVCGVEVTLKALHLATTWTDRAQQATSYRHQRILLAGDAAHIHSPLGGQGLNLGLGDAMNLGWKLASTVLGTAPCTLLDTYFSERHPVGAQVLDWSRAQVALMRPAPSSRALEAILRDLIETSDGATYFAERIWGLSLRYDLGSGHPLVGRLAPEIRFVDGSRPQDHSANGHGLLLDFERGAPLRGLAARWSGRIGYLAQDVEDRLGGLGAMLVRPDGIVAWVGEHDPDLEELASVAERWFGQP